ncbi:hypothetical protein PISMIDRAFT_194854 [Pisolithus microcarpus 441]|uniref:Uncharacterized protein n=1 Tax=Pisolithus microcarpus 441 TaxID=765257 RepID=A0A0C9YNA1_9AGAM|nr:hypothetical protein PISMIDRAFT_194854 [Pisolithus microcarpus 441]
MRGFSYSNTTRLEQALMECSACTEEVTVPPYTACQFARITVHTCSRTSAPTCILHIAEIGDRTEDAKSVLDWGNQILRDTCPYCHALGGCFWIKKVNGWSLRKCELPIFTFQEF